MSNNNTNNKVYNLFDYTEEELLGNHNDEKNGIKDTIKLNYYEILNVQYYATSDDIKKAYRKCSLKYHPDKTGRGENDYVFLAVKAAYDTLYDKQKRQAYDSTILPFDDNIPPSRNVLIAEDALYQDEDFYELYKPVFERNLRFDARLRPDLKKNNNNNHTRKHKQNHHHITPPSLGDANTPIDEVHKFYEYWVHFESWRDFTSAAAAELDIDIESTIENCESRYEKRFYQKEIDKKAKQLKKNEMIRIQTLVERAMDTDPRLRKERQQQIEAKENAKKQKEIQKQQQLEQKQREKELELQKEQEEKQLIIQQKQEKEKMKKLIRKEKQIIRKLASTQFQKQSSNDNNDQNNNNKCSYWNDEYDMNEDINNILFTFITELNELKQLNVELHNNANTNNPLEIIYNKIEEIKQKNDENEEKKIENDDDNNNEQQQQQKSTTNTLDWTKNELSALAKGVKKFPPGNANRWEQISSFVNTICKQSIPRTKEECITTYNHIAKNSTNNKPTTTTTTTTNNNNSSNDNTTTNTADTAVTTTTTTTTTTTSINSTIQNNKEENNSNINSDDIWTVEQDQQLQDGLAKYPTSMEKNERWTAISKSVTGKTKKQCVQRFKTIRQALLQNKK